MKKYYVYIIECRNGSYYTGYTIDMERRYQEHVQGSAKCKYTRSFPPKELAACWQLDSLQQALSFEKKIKAMTKTEKKRLIESNKCSISA